MKAIQSEVEAITDNFVNYLKNRIKAQTEYNFTHNFPNSVTFQNMTSEEMATQALQIAVASTIGNYNKYDISKSGEFAVEILENVNAHPEAAALQKMLYTEN